MTNKGNPEIPPLRGRDRRINLDFAVILSGAKDLLLTLNSLNPEILRPKIGLRMTNEGKHEILRRKKRSSG